jgi:hypothetical protein
MFANPEPVLLGWKNLPMTPEEKAYEVALSHVRHEETERGTGTLDLRGLWDIGRENEFGELSRFPTGLERLTSLRRLIFSGCPQLSGDLSPLAGLTSHHRFDLGACFVVRILGIMSGKSLNGSAHA